MRYFSGAWRHRIQIRFFVISTMDQSGDTSREMPQCTMSCGPSSIGLHNSDMLMPIPASVWFVKGAPTKIGSQQPCYNLLQWKNHSKSGAWISLGKFPSFIEATSLYLDCYSLFHTVDRGSSAETSEWSGSHQLFIAEYHFQVQDSYVTCFWQCNILFFIKSLWFFIGKWYFLETFY